MKIQFKVLLLILSLILVASLQAQSAEELRVPSEDALNKYYLGVSEDMTSLQEALNQSFRNAAETAIRENFGFESKFERTTFQDAKDSQLSVIHHEKSAQIKLEGFETLKSQVTQNPSTQKYTVKTIYKYPKASLQKELQRLQSAQEEPEMLSEVGDSNLGKASLELRTVPSNAALTIDGIQFPNTPVRILGQIEVGTHKLTIDHPYFETIEEDIMFHPKEIVSRRIVLKPANAEISVDSNLTETQVLINNQPIGLTPIRHHLVPAGKSFSLELRRKDAYPVQFPQMSFNKGPQDLGTLEMKLKPGILVLTGAAHGCVIKIDETPQKLGERKFQLSPGTHRLQVSQKGYEDQNLTVDIEALITTSKTITLEKTDEVEKKRKLEQALEETKRQDALARSQFFADHVYFNLQAQLEFQGSPLKEIKEGPICGTLEADLGIRNWVGVSMAAKGGSGGDPNQTLTAETITALRGRKTGIWFHLRQEHQDSLSIGYESEDSELEVAMTNTQTYKNTAKTVKINGSGPSLMWNGGFGHGGLISLQLGSKGMKSNTKGYTGQDQFYLSLGLGLDLFGK